MEKDDDIRDGDMIVTSNISEKFLPGILIGYATDITVDYNDNLTKSGYVIPVAQFDLSPGGAGDHRSKGGRA